MQSIPTPYININEETYSHLITYMIYQNGKLYILHPDKKIALNIPPTSLFPFIQEVEKSLKNQLTKSHQIFQVISFELLAKIRELKPKKVRTTFLPEAVFLIPSIKTDNKGSSVKLINTKQHITLPPQESRHYQPSFTPDKNHFINQIKQLQKRNPNKTTFNQKFIQDNTTQEEILLQNLQSDQKKFLLKTPDFSIFGSIEKTTQIPFPDQSLQANIKLESHHRNFQNGCIIISNPHTQEKTIYKITNSIESIQNNLYTNIIQNIKPTSKQFDVYKKAVSKNKSLLKQLNI